MLPKVSILIPTYNRPHYFEQALKSVLDQTYPHIEIIVCDNSDNNQTEQIVKKLMLKVDESEIKYVRNAQNIGPIANQQQCFDLSTGEFVNYLMDDDLFHPEKIEKMMHYFLKYDDITLVTSYRKTIDSSGLPLDMSHKIAFKKLYQHDTIIDGIELGNLMLRHTKNFIGEPTTVLFRKLDLEEPFGAFLGKQAHFNVDVATWLNLLAKGKAVYIAEPLSYCRIHSHQISQSREERKIGGDDWRNHIANAPLKGFLKERG